MSRLRILVAAVAAAPAALCLVHYANLRSDHLLALQLVETTGLNVRLPDVARQVERERDPQWAKLAVARALLAENLDRRWLNDLEPLQRRQEAARLGERLELAHDLAVESLQVRPATWQAAMLLGGVGLVTGERSGLPGLLSTRKTWETSIRTAMVLAPGEEEPHRLLAAAYLGIWPSLTASEQSEALHVFARSFEDENTFRLFVESWLQLAGSREEAFAVVPDSPWAWSLLVRSCARRADWRSYIEAFRRWDAALLAELGRDVEQAEKLGRGGHRRDARSLLISVIRRARRDRRYAKDISRALVECPPGPADGRDLPVLMRLLDWALEQHVNGNPAIESRAVERLAAVVGGLRPEQEALVALVTGHRYRAEAIERRSGDLATEVWAPYLLLKARLLAGDGDTEGARTALNKIHSSRRGTVPELALRRLIAGKAGEPAAEVSAERELRRLARRRWPAREWRWQGTTARLHLLPEVGAEGLEIRFGGVPQGGRPVEVRFDQQLAVVEVASAGEVLIAPMEVTPEPHLLEVENLERGKAAPGEVRLVLAEPKP